MFRTIIVVLLALVIAACRRDAPSSAPAFEATAVQLWCEYPLMSEGEPVAAVFTQVEDSRVKLADMLLCDSIAKPNWPTDLALPASTLRLIGGRNAVTGQYLYVAQEQNELAYYYIAAAENGQWQHKALARYIKGKFHILRPLHLSDLCGYYLQQDPDSSRVLYVALNGPDLSGKVFCTAEPLPPSKLLHRALPYLDTLPESILQTDLMALRLQSPLGTADIDWKQDSTALTFHSWLGKTQKMRFELIQD